MANAIRLTGRRFAGYLPSGAAVAAVVLISGLTAAVCGGPAVAAPGRTDAPAVRPGTGFASAAAVAREASGERPVALAPKPSRERAVALAPKPSRERAVTDARAVVRRHGAAIHAAAGETYQARSVVLDPDGARHIRFDRTYRGLPVLGGDYVIHANPDGAFRDATVAQRRPISVGTVPTVTAEAATAIAVRAFDGEDGVARPRLVVDAREGTPVLAWQVSVLGTGTGGLPRDVDVIVDARSGAVRRTVQRIQTVEDGSGHGLHVGEVALSTGRRADGTYELTDPSRGGSETRDALDQPYPDVADSVAFTDADNAWGSGDRSDRATVAVDVHYGVAQAWDYFRLRHGRDGVRDDGRGAVALVHQAGRNAAWYDDCFCMQFGDGDDTAQPFTSLDIVAHEMSHGVTAATAGLEYAGESGGLSEATSDIFGTLVEFYANNPADPPDYLVGEHLDNGGDGLPLRYMDDPTRDGKSAGCWNPELGTLDVHYSSGVGNKFFYLLAVGSGRSAWGESNPCGDAPAVTGIGNDKAGQIWYRALTTYLLSNANYSAARQGTLLAAADLFGADGPEYAAVDAAWKAVGVDGSDPVPNAPAIRRPGNQKGDVGDVVSLRIKAVDPQGDPITFSATDLPPGLSISESGLISGTLTTEGWWYVKVSVTDAAGHASQTYFFWDVFGPPVVENPGDQTHPVGGWVTLFIEATDASPGDLTYSATGLPDGLEMPPGYNFVYGVPEAVGVWQPSITVTDSTGASTTVSFRWTITAS